MKQGFNTTSGCCDLDTPPIQNAEDGEENWLECIPWTGEEADLPAGEVTKIPNFRAINLVKVWEVLDAASDAGMRVVAPADLKPDDIIIGAQINENSVKAIMKTYGKRFFVAKRAGGGPLLDRSEWKKQYGTDVIELEALKQIRKK